MVRGGRHRGDHLLSFAVMLVLPGAGFHGRLDPPSGKEARLGQDQEEVGRTWLEQPGGGTALNPWLSSALWPCAWGQGQLHNAWGPDRNF